MPNVATVKKRFRLDWILAGNKPSGRKTINKVKHIAIIGFLRDMSKIIIPRIPMEEESTRNL
jgi:hypothetical protein